MTIPTSALLRSLILGSTLIGGPAANAQHDIRVGYRAWYRTMGDSTVHDAILVEAGDSTISLLPYTPAKKIDLLAVRHEQFTLPISNVNMIATKRTRGWSVGGSILFGVIGFAGGYLAVKEPTPEPPYNNSMTSSMAFGGGGGRGNGAEAFGAGMLVSFVGCVLGSRVHLFKKHTCIINGKRKRYALFRSTLTDMDLR